MFLAVVFVDIVQTERILMLSLVGLLTLISSECSKSGQDLQYLTDAGCVVLFW